MAKIKWETKEEKEIKLKENEEKISLKDRVDFLEAEIISLKELLNNVTKHY